jgi:hypothetical protein
MPTILHSHVKNKGNVTACRTGSAEMERRVKRLQVEVRSLHSLLDSILICLRAQVDGGSNYSIDTVLEAIMHEICQNSHRAPEIQ